MFRWFQKKNNVATDAQAFGADTNLLQHNAEGGDNHHYGSVAIDIPSAEAGAAAPAIALKTKFSPVPINTLVRIIDCFIFDYDQSDEWKWLLSLRLVSLDWNDAITTEVTLLPFVVAKYYEKIYVESRNLRNPVYLPLYFWDILVKRPQATDTEIIEIIDQLPLKFQDKFLPSLEAMRIQFGLEKNFKLADLIKYIIHTLEVKRGIEAYNTLLLAMRKQPELTPLEQRAATLAPHLTIYSHVHPLITVPLYLAWMFCSIKSINPTYRTFGSVVSALVLTGLLSSFGILYFYIIKKCEKLGVTFKEVCLSNLSIKIIKEVQKDLPYIHNMFGTLAKEISGGMPIQSHSICWINKPCSENEGIGIMSKHLDDNKPSAAPAAASM